MLLYLVKLLYILIKIFKLSFDFINVTFYIMIVLFVMMKVPGSSRVFTACCSRFGSSITYLLQICEMILAIFSYFGLLQNHISDMISNMND